MEFIDGKNWIWKRSPDQSEMSQHSTLNMIGWREWCRLDELGLGWVDARIDTGTRTSALHVREISSYRESGNQKVEFMVHPHQQDNDSVVVCNATVIDQREVKGPSGYKEKRWVIQSTVSLGDFSWTIPFTLTSHEYVRFRMLLGRTALQDKFLVDSSKSYLMGNV